MGERREEKERDRERERISLPRGSSRIYRKMGNAKERIGPVARLKRETYMPVATNPRRPTGARGSAWRR